jgi:Flp pilus assembly protein TadG
MSAGGATVVRLPADESGSALLEFALILSVMVFLLLGTVDYTCYILREMQIQNAATAGAAYGAVPGNESNLTGIQSYTVALAPYVNGVTATATNVWACSPGGTSVLSTSLCTGNVTPYKYVVVTTKATIPVAMTYPGIPASTALKATAMMRVPWTP